MFSSASRVNIAQCPTGTQRDQTTAQHLEVTDTADRGSGNLRSSSPVPGPPFPVLFLLRFAFSIIYGSRKAMKSGGGLGTRLHSSTKIVTVIILTEALNLEHSWV